MKKLNKKAIAILGTAIVALGVMAIPALASSGGSGNWFSQMHTLMNQTFTPAQQQQFMNSSAMQDLHNSQAMQDAMQNQDFGKMQSLMNSDQALKQQIGPDNVGKMNQMMGQLQGQYQSLK